MTTKDDILEIKDNLKEIKNILVHNSTWINQAHHDLYGNGKKGLITRVEDLESLDKQDSVMRAKIIRIDQELNGTQKDIKYIHKKIAYYSGMAVAIVFIMNKIVELLQ